MHDGAGFGRTENARRSDLRFLERLTAVLAVALVVAGAVIGAWPDVVSTWLPTEMVDLSDERARAVGTVMILAGIADTLVLYYWDRLFE